MALDAKLIIIMVVRVKVIKTYYNLGNTFTLKQYGQVHFTPTNLIELQIFREKESP